MVAGMMAAPIVLVVGALIIGAGFLAKGLTALNG